MIGVCHVPLQERVTICVTITSLLSPLPLPPFHLNTYARNQPTTPNPNLYFTSDDR
jgi:hypothetical protein